MDHSAGIPSVAGKHKHARACFTCGETSHIARNCPAGGGEEERSTPTVRTHSHQRPKPPKQHKLFVTGLPRYGTARRWKNRIADTFRSADIKISKIRLGVNDSNHLKGFFYVNVLSTDEPRALAATLHAFNEETETTYSLTLSKSTPGKVDMLFPSLSYEQRARLKFDPTAVFSCSDELTADLTTRISLAMCNLGTVDLDKGAGLSVLDMFGCVGGNAISYAKSKKFDSVTSVELDEGRCEMLRHNVQIASCNKERYDPACVNCIQGDGVAVGMSKYHHVIWLDPPWGGNEYKKGGKEIEKLAAIGLALFAVGATEGVPAEVVSALALAVHLHRVLGDRLPEDSHQSLAHLLALWPLQPRVAPQSLHHLDLVHLGSWRRRGRWRRRGGAGRACSLARVTGAVEECPRRPFASAASARATTSAPGITTDPALRRVLW